MRQLKSGRIVQCSRRQAVIGVASSCAAVLLGTRVRAERRIPEWHSEVLRLPNTSAGKAPVVSALAISRAGEQVAIAGDDHHLRVWHLGEAEFVAEFSGHRDWVRTLAYSPDGRRLASAGNDRRWIIWDMTSPQVRVLREVQLDHPITRAVFDPTGERIAIVGFRTPLKVFDVRSGHEIWQATCPCEDMRAVAFSSDNRALAAGGRNGIVRVWDLGSETIATEYRGHQRRIHDIAFSPDDTRIASCSDDRSIYVTGLDGSDAFRLKCPEAKCMSLAFCGNRQIAAGATDNAIHIFDLDSRQESVELAGHTGTIAALVYSDGALVSAGFDTTVRVWRRNQNLAGEVTPPPQLGERLRATDLR